MIQPHQSDTLKPLFVQDETRRQALLHEAEQLHSVTLSSAAAANAVMLGGGYFTPLEGFMSLEDALSVADDMRTTSGVFFPIPILNVLPSAEGIEVGQQVALRDPNVEGQPILAVQQVQAIQTVSDAQMQHLTQQIFATTDEAHPGVAAFNSAGRVLLSGPVQVLNFSYFEKDFAGTFKTAYEIRAEIERLGWSTVVAFQTRNPMHLAHEELCRMAMQQLGADGVLVHMLLGKLKPGDIPADVRDACIRTMVDKYFEPNTVLVTGYGFDMLYAGPREALLHALFRQNAGCTHLIVGRDHAGVGSTYGPFDAQAIFDDSRVKGAMQIEIFAADHTAWSKKLGRVVMMRDVPDHDKSDFILLSGTKVRELLSEGTPPPPEFTRPEVAEILMKHYQS